MVTAIYQSVGGSRSALKLSEQELSYRFELESNGNVIATFVMGLPPQQFSRTAKLRASLDKTFGGTTLELGQADNENITMRGTFGGNRVHAWFGEKQMTGLDAYKAFKEKIVYFTQRRTTPFFNKKLIPVTAIKFYDLYASETKYVHIQQFNVERNSARPYFWDYNITMTTIDKPKTPLNELDKLLKVMDDAKETVAGIGDTFDEFSSFVTGNISKVNDLANSALDIADSALDMADTAIQLVNKTGEQVLQLTDTVLKAPVNLIARLDTIISATQDIADTATAFLDQWDAIVNGEYGKVLESQFHDVMTHAKSISIMCYIERKRTADLSGMSPSIDETVQGSTDQQTTASDTNVSAEPKGTGRAAHIEKRVVGASETLEDIAIEYFGDKAYTVILAEYNNLTTTHLEVGQLLYIPRLETDVITYENNVIDRNLDKYGKDIECAGELSVSSTGDLQILTGVDCLIQSLQARWRFILGELYSDTTYGTDVSQIGRKQSAESLALLQVKVIETLEQEERIKEIEKIVYVFSETGLQIEVDAVLQDDFLITVPLTVVS